MGELFSRLLDFMRELWPFRKVEPWQRGVVTVLGRFWRTVGPGVYPVVPWFVDVEGFSVVPAVVSTPRLDVELADGTLVSFVATMTLTVTDVEKAVLRVSDYEQSSVEAVSAVLAEKLAEVDPSRLAPERRRRLFSDLQRWASEEVEEWGIELSKLRFTTFVSKPRVWRLLGDTPLSGW